MDKSNEYDYLLKLIIIGDSNTGKSCLLHQFIDQKFKRNSTHTIGVEFGCKSLDLGDGRVKLQIWDTAGQERFRSVTRSYYRGAAGALIVYDITNEESFRNLESWLTDARTLARPDLVIMIIGNKFDLKDLRKVTFLDASKFCQENEVQFLETSALNGENVQEAFQKISKTILHKLKSGSMDPNSLPPSIQPGLQKPASRKCEKCLIF